MVPSLLARADGLPETLLDRQVVWPTPPGNGHRRRMSAKQLAKLERQTAVVHAAVLPVWARALLDEQEADAELRAIRTELRGASLL